MATKEYLITAYNGAVKLYFDSLWDGTKRFINQYDIVPIMWSVNNGAQTEYTHDGFELINKSDIYDVLVLGGYVIPDSYSHNFYIFIETWSPTTGSTGGWNYNGTLTAAGTDYPFDGLGTTQYYDTFPKVITMSGGVNNTCHFDCNIPIFDSEAHWHNFVETGDTTGCYNADDEWQLDTTDYYWIYNHQSSGKLFNGTMTEVSGATRAWHSLKFSANERPVLYFNNDFGLTLNARAIVASKAVNGPGYVIDNIPEEGWTEGRLEYSGPFYGTLESRIEFTGSLPDNGTYSYGLQVDTNIPIFKTKADADHAIETGDYSEAGNAYGLESGNTHLPVTTGDNDASTTFGDGPATSPFVTSYVCTKNDVLNVANTFYTNDPSILDNIKAGLSLMGSEPFQALCGLSWFPFDLSKVVTAQAQNYIYFGSYQYQPGSLSIDKVLSYKNNGYLDAGSIYIAPLFSSYRDLAPWTQLQIYIPFHGWEAIDIAKYYKKTINIRYYVDIYTNTYACALVASGGGKSYIGDIFSGNIGMTLPLSGSNMSEYGNSMLRAVLGTAGGVGGGMLSGAMVGSLPGAIVGGAVGGGIALAGGLFEMGQKGTPKDHLMVKGAYSGASAAYMPTNVIIRYDIHNLIVPKNLTELYGRPSSASGPVSNFSGFLQADTFKLSMDNIMDAEAKEIEQYMKEGIFI